MNQRKRAVWGFILCSLLCCGAGVSAKEAAAGEKAAMPLCILHRKSAGRENGGNKKIKSAFFRKNTCQMHEDVIEYLSAAKGLCDTSRAGQRYA